MHNDLFINNELNLKIEKDGVVLIPFLNEEELNKIKAFYVEMHGNAAPPTTYDGIHMTIWHSDLDYKLKIKETLEKLIHAACERAFKDYRLVIPQFIVKQPGHETIFHIHQDWSVIDESKYVSFNIWIPLHDVDEENGAMWIVKGSHRINRKIRGAGYLFPAYKPVFEDLKPYMTRFPMKAGEALLFYHSTLHGSSENRSSKDRVVVQVSALPKEAPFHIYFQKNETDTLKVFHPQDDFSYRYNKLFDESHVVTPADVVVNELPSMQVTAVTAEEILKAINK